MNKYTLRLVWITLWFLFTCDIAAAQSLLFDQGVFEAVDIVGNSTVIQYEDRLYCFSEQKQICEFSKGGLVGGFLEPTGENQSKLVICESDGRKVCVVKWIDTESTKVVSEARLNFNDEIFQHMSNFRKTGIPGVFLFSNSRGLVLWRHELNEFWFLTWDKGRVLRHSHSYGIPAEADHLSRRCLDTARLWGIESFEMFPKGAVATIRGDDSEILEVFEFKTRQDKISFDSRFSTPLSYRRLRYEIFEPMFVRLHSDFQHVLVTSRIIDSPKITELHTRSLNIATRKWLPETSTIRFDTNFEIYDVFLNEENELFVGTKAKNGSNGKKVLDIRQYPSLTNMKIPEKGSWVEFSKHGPIQAFEDKGRTRFFLLDLPTYGSSEIGSVKVRKSR